MRADERPYSINALEMATKLLQRAETWTMGADDAARIREACGSLGQLEAFALGGVARTILVACMEIRSCYAVNLWCDAPELANEVEAFLTKQEITSHRTWEFFSGGISVGYTVNEVLDAASTVMIIAKILKIPAHPGRARQIIQTIT